MKPVAPSVPRIPFSKIDRIHSFVPEDRDPRGYHVEIDPSPFYILIVGVPAFTPAASFNYRNLLYRQPRVHNFKHYLPGGGKKWTSRCGVDLAFAIAAPDISLIEEAGYSYPRVQVGALQFTLNVSGGTGGERGWVDWVHVTSHTSVHKSAAFPKALSQHAMSPRMVTGFDPSTVAAMEENERRGFAREFYKKLILPRLTQGDPVIAMNNEEYAYDSRSTGRRGRARQSIICRDHSLYRIALADVDWIATAKRLGRNETPELDPWINSFIPIHRVPPLPAAEPIPEQPPAAESNIVQFPTGRRRLSPERIAQLAASFA